MQVEATQAAHIKLPAIGAEFEGGKFRGVATLRTGEHVAIVHLATADKKLNHGAAETWAEGLGGVLPIKGVYNVMLTTSKDAMPKGATWLAETYGASFAWSCISHGGQYDHYRSAELGAVAVRLIPLAI